MHSRLLLSIALLASAFTVSSSPLHAQFQEPTKEELQMTADPQAPGAAAVYLYREEITDDNLHYHSLYVRMKILSEKGKEEATVHVPYDRTDFKVTDIHGRTIHSDGTVIPLTAKPSDLTDIKTAGYQRNTMVFTLPNVEVGSIIEYRLQIRYDDNMVSSPQWEIQQPYYVHKAHYLFVRSSDSGYITNSRGDALKFLMWSLHAKPDSKIVEDSRQHYTLDITDIPATPSEDWMPPLNSLNWRCQFYYTQYTTGQDFWQNESKRWAHEADNFADPGKDLPKAVAGIVAPTDSESLKAHKIYDAVMKLDNTDFSREKSAAERKKENLKNIKNASDVWNQKSAPGDELALLYVAMARAAGLKAYPAKVVNRNRAIFDPSYLTTYQLDDYLAIVVTDGKEVTLDPGQKDCPFGLLHWKHAFASGLRGTDKGPNLFTTPANIYSETQVARIADLALDTEGSVTGSVRYVLNGQQALYWRHIAIENDTEEVKKRFNESIRGDLPDGVQADFDHFIGLDDYTTNLLAIVKVSGSMGSSTGKRYFLPAMFFESRAKHPFVAEDKRLAPIDVEYPRVTQDQVNYRLPAGYTVENLPPASNVSWPSHALLRTSITAADGAVTVARSLAYNYTLLEPKSYADLHEFFQKVATTDQQQLVLTRAAAATAKGN
ncbi:MAG TPA: DUF3857 domain-containing protein [Terracidiphilus sp.]|nr:DUF3857 domain-containing protein [Terracidiphilus sp.]